MKAHLTFMILIVIISGCAQQETLSNNGDIAQTYLEDQGYEIVSYDGDGSYQFSEKDLRDLPDQAIWDVQYADPEDFVEKRLYKANFTVKNHPLDQKLYGTDPHYLDQTHVTVFIFDGEVIGGTSYPASKEPLSGCCYSLDGKTFEEIHHSP
jgi:hypothetical protein